MRMATALSIFDQAMADVDTEYDSFKRGDLRSQPGLSLVPDATERRGKFIVYDGIDGSGKGTQIAYTERLLTTLGIPCVIIKQPGGSTLGVEIRKVLFETVGTKNICDDSQELLFMASYAQNALAVKKHLAAGTWVLADRWSPAALSYMATVRNATPAIQDWHRELVKDLKWDLFFLLVGNPNTLVQRAQARTTETHQAGKTWNNGDAMSRVQDYMLARYSLDPGTRIVDTTRYDADWLFEKVIGPTLNRDLHINATEEQIRSATLVQ